MKKPNIVIFNPDHYRGEALAHLGNPCVVTPNLDQLVQTDGVSFSNTFCQNPVCTPSRCCFMTGWYPHVRGHRTMAHMLRQDEPDLLSRLKDAGYFVWWGGKNDLVPAQHGFDRQCHVKYQPKGKIKPDLHSLKGWRGDPDDDTFFSFFHGKLEKEEGEEFYYDSDWANVLGAIDQIGDLPEDKPFCLYLPLSYPHPPFAVEEPFFSMIDRNKVPDRIPTPDNWDMRPTMEKGIYERTGMQGWTEERWNELRAVHYGMCSRIDSQFGMLCDALKKQGVYEDTAIFFFSDHGMYAGDYGLVDINQNTFEDALTHVPFLIKPPSGTPMVPGINDSLVELTDFVATVEDMTGLPETHTHFGKSLLPLMAGEKCSHRDAVFCEGGRRHGETHCMELEAAGTRDKKDLYYPRLSFQASNGPEHGKGTMCRTNDFKYIRRIYEEDELYDLKKDPREMNNLINDPHYSAVLQNLRERMLEWYMQTADVVPLDYDKRG
jgi:arylsulfatase A-like enzyme